MNLFKKIYWRFFPEYMCKHVCAHACVRMLTQQSSVQVGVVILLTKWCLSVPLEFILFSDWVWILLKSYSEKDSSTKCSMVLQVHSMCLRSPVSLSASACHYMLYCAPGCTKAPVEMKGSKEYKECCDPLRGSGERHKQEWFEEKKYKSN